jgi:AraC-like DNA-binding protein
MTRYVALMRSAKSMLNAPALALEFCEDTRFDDPSIVGLIVQTCASMSEALVQLNRYGRLVVEVDLPGTAERFRTIRRKGALWLEDTRPLPDAFPELTESTFARFACEFARHFDGQRLATAVHVTHERPAHADAYVRVLGAPVSFNAGWNALQLNEAAMARPFDTPNRYVFGVLSERASTLLGQLARDRTLRAQVETLLLPLLHKGDANVAEVALALGVSRQTLHRKLKVEGVTFEGILDDLRHRMALNYLAGMKLSVSEVAYLVGFAEPSSFTRAFKRWTGRSPKAANR